MSQTAPLTRVDVSYNPEGDWDKYSPLQTIWEPVKKHSAKEKAVGMHHLSCQNRCGQTFITPV